MKIYSKAKLKDGKYLLEFFFGDVYSYSFTRKEYKALIQKIQKALEDG